MEGALDKLNPNSIRKDYNYRPGGPVLRDVLKEELEKTQRTDEQAAI